MRALICIWLACAGAISTNVALAAPGADAKYRAAVQLVNSGSVDQALALIDEGLALIPDHSLLLSLKGRVMLALRDYPGALAAYERYLKSGVTGANQRKALQIVKSLAAVRTTFLHVTLANGPAAIYLDSRTLGVFCTAAPSCNKPILPGEYKVIGERSGFEVWTDHLTISPGSTARVAITLVEKPSLLTVRVAQPEATVMVDGRPYDAPAVVAAGTHQVVVSLARHREARLEAAAHEGKPVELYVALTPLTAIRVEPANATLLLDGRPIAIEPDGIAVPLGTHALVARADGFQERRVDLPADRSIDREIVVVLQRLPPPPPPPPPLFTPRRKVALAVAGLSVAATAIGIVLGVQSEHLKDDAFALCPSASVPCASAAEANRVYEDGRSRALQADISFGVAGAAALATAVLWLTGAPEPRVAIRPQLGTLAGVDVIGRF